MMNRGVKAKWLDALRSGRYEQGFNRLRTGDKYCVLGVLEDVCGTKWTESNESNYKGIIRYYPEGHPAQIDLTEKTILASGLLFGDPKVGEDDTLMGLNDIKRLNFKEIADRIEAEL